MKKKEEATLADYVFGKEQPSAIPLEEAVIGACLLVSDAYREVEGILLARREGKDEVSGSFYLDAHNRIWFAITELANRFLPVDLLTVTEKLKELGWLESIGGAYYLIELTNRVASSANIEYHARIVAQRHTQRELIKLGSKMVRDGYEDVIPLQDQVSAMEKGVFDITQQGFSKGYSHVSDIVSTAVKQLESIKGTEGLTGLPTGFTNLDRITNGWQASDLIIVAARPSVGKTSMVLCQALNAARDFQKPVAFFSLEMSKEQLVMRLLSMMAEVPSERLRAGNLYDHEWQRLYVQVEILSSLPIYIDDTPGISLSEMRSKCRKMRVKHDIQGIFVDYLQLMSGDKSHRAQNEEQEISAISKGLKGLAKEINVPVIALSQLSRAVEVRGGSKRPQLSDLRSSGSIEQDADIVLFLYRPEYHGIMEDETGNSLKGVVEQIIAKHRNGKIGTIKAKFIGEYAKFTDPDDGIDWDKRAAIMSQDVSVRPPENWTDEIPFD